MASESIRFDFLTSGAEAMARQFKNVGGTAAAAARGAEVLKRNIESLGSKEGRTAEESARLARALRLTGDAEDRAAAKALAADIAIRRLADAEAKAADNADKADRKSQGLGKTLGDLKLNPGLVGPLLALTPALTTLTGVAAGAAVGLAGAFTAGAGALAAFGAVAKPVLSDALKASQAVNAAQNTYQATLAAGVPKAQAQARLQAANASALLTYNAALKAGANPAKALAAYHLALTRNQLAYNSATNKGVYNAAAYRAEQLAIAKAYAGLSPAQIALSRQLGNMAQAWQDVKAAQTPVVAGALVPWLKSVTDLTGHLGPVIAKVSPVIAYLGTQFDALIRSPEFRAFRDFIGSTGSAAVSATGTTLIDFVKGFIILLPRFDPLIREAVGWISRLGPAFLKWASGKKSADQIQAFIRFFSQNGSLVTGLLRNLGGALKALAPGLTNSGALELKAISAFLGLVAKLPPAIAKPLAEVAGAALILSKLGVLKVGLKIIGPALKWLTGGVINIGGGAAVGAEIRAAFASGGAEAGAEIRAALASGGAAAGAEGGAGAAGAAAASIKTRLPPLLVPVAAALAPVLSGLISGLVIKGVGDTLSPSGTFAGNLNKNLQKTGSAASTSLLHSFTFGGLESWLAAKFGIPVGKVINDTLTSLGRRSKTTTAQVSQNFAAMSDVVKAKVTAGFNAAQRAMAAAGTRADYLRIRNLGPLGSRIDAVSRQTLNLGGTVTGRLNPAINSGGNRADAFRIRNLNPLGSKIDAVNRETLNLQRSISNLHGKTVDVGVHGSGSGGARITVSSVGGGPFAGKLVAISNRAAGGIITGGTAGRDSVPAMLTPGEVVVPARMVKSGAVDHLRGRLPGFAAGGLVNPSPDVFGSRVENSYGGSGGSSFGAVMRSAFTALVQQAVQAVRAAAAAATRAASAAGSGGGPTSADAAQAQNYARSRLAAYGWALDQMNPLIALWNQESGWNRFAYNASSGATGIPQALPYTKMPRAAWLPSQGGQASAGAQIDWGLGYIKGRYGSPAGAWGHEVAFNWYDRGGWLKPGLTLALNSTGRPEQVVPAGGGRQRVVLEIRGSGSGTFDAFLLKWIQEHVRIRGGGNVQHAFGRRT